MARRLSVWRTAFDRTYGRYERVPSPVGSDRTYYLFSVYASLLQAEEILFICLVPEDIFLGTCKTLDNDGATKTTEWFMIHIIVGSFGAFLLDYVFHIGSASRMKHRKTIFTDSLFTGSDGEAYPVFVLYL